MLLQFLLYKCTETQSDDHSIMYISITKKYNDKTMVVDRGGVSTFFPKTYNKYLPDLSKIKYVKSL